MLTTQESKDERQRRTLEFTAILPVLGEVVQEPAVRDEDNLLLRARLQPAPARAGALLDCVRGRRVAALLVVPAVMHVLGVDGQLLGVDLAAQVGRVAARVAGHVARLLGVRQQDQLQIRAALEDGLEALQGGVDGAAKGRRRHQVDAVVEGEAIAQLAALLVAQVRQEGVVDDVVGDRDVVDALDLLVSVSRGR